MKFGASFFSSSSSLLNYCCSTKVLGQVHAKYVLYGLHQDPSICSDLISRYAFLGRSDLSQCVFHYVNAHDASLYCSIIKALFLNGKPEGAILYYREMLLKSLHPDEIVYQAVVDACTDLWLTVTAKMVHCHVIKLGFASYIHVAAAIAKMYTEIDEISNVKIVVDTVPFKSVGIWNALISSANGHGIDRFRFLASMTLERFRPDSETIVSMLKSSTDLNYLCVGKSVHGIAVVNGLVENLSVNTALLTMYCKMQSLETARMVFDNIFEKDSVVWNIMISGYSQNGYARSALDLLIQMGNCGIKTDLFTAIASISSAAYLGLIDFGKQIHGNVIRNRSDDQVSVYNALVDMYSKCKSLDYAKKVFDLVVNKTVVSWSSMIKGCLINDQPSCALLLFDQMRIDGVKPDSITVINILPACVRLVGLPRAQSIHSYAIKQGIILVTSLVTALLDTYAKCGCLQMAQNLFDDEASERKDIVSWNSIISAHSNHGNWVQCFELYGRMISLKVKPDLLTFLGLLTVCVNSGLVNEGRKYFHQMIEVYGYQPEQGHYACMIDLLGRSGHFDEAITLIKNMPFKADALVWGSLLSSCMFHSNTWLAEFVAERLISLEPKNAGNYIMLSNIYAATGKWDGVAKMRSFLRGGDLRKKPGCSWLEINGLVHEFRVADRSHSDTENIYSLLRVIEREIKMDVNLHGEIYS